MKQAPMLDELVDEIPDQEWTSLMHLHAAAMRDAIRALYAIAHTIRTAGDAISASNRQGWHTAGEEDHKTP